MQKAETGRSFHFDSLMLMVCTFDGSTYFQIADLNWRLFVWYFTWILACGDLARCTYLLHGAESFLRS